MKQEPEHWPVHCEENLNDEPISSELVKNPRSLFTLFVNTSKQHLQAKIGEIIDLERFSTLAKLLRVVAYVLLRVVAYVLKFVALLKARIKRIKEFVNSQPLEAKDITSSENFVTNLIQREHFQSEIDFLSGISKQSTLYISQFNLFIDENGLLRCRTRLQNAATEFHTKNPMLLPARNLFSKLVVLQCHKEVLHNGTRETLCRLRKRFWIPKSRQLIKSTIRECIICKRAEGKSYESPPVPPLPSYRVADTPPFTNTGLDFLGPLLITNRKDKTVEKTYCLLWTCLSTRAVHLELCRNLTVAEFLMCFRRFSNRKGLPSLLLSDNASTFKSSSLEIRKLRSSEKVRTELSNQRVTWQNVTEKAAWFGGAWERLVRSVKRFIKKTIGKTLLDFMELSTLIVEIESILNARPLTFVYSDSDSDICLFLSFDAC